MIPLSASHARRACRSAGGSPPLGAARAHPEQLGDWLGVSAWWVDRLEAGAPASDRYLPAIAEATSVDVGWLRSLEFPPVVEQEELRGRGVAADALGRALVLGSIVLLVVVRFFTEVVPVVPRASNFVDIPIFIGLVATAALLQVTPVPVGSIVWVSAPPSIASSRSPSSWRPRVGRIAPAPWLCSSSGSSTRLLSMRRSTASGRPAIPRGRAGLVGLGIAELWSSRSSSCRSSF